jgi:hypothetical protein
LTPACYGSGTTHSQWKQHPPQPPQGDLTQFCRHGRLPTLQVARMRMRVSVTAPQLARTTSAIRTCPRSFSTTTGKRTTTAGDDPHPLASADAGMSPLSPLQPCNLATLERTARAFRFAQCHCCWSSYLHFAAVARIHRSCRPMDNAPSWRTDYLLATSVPHVVFYK